MYFFSLFYEKLILFQDNNIINPTSKVYFVESCKSLKKEEGGASFDSLDLFLH